MFEAHVLHLLRRYLGEYVHGLSTEALKISVWKGDVVLRDLQLKAEALNALKLPITVKAGFLGSVTLKVPWKSLGKEPVIVLIDRVFVLAEPAQDECSFTEEDKERLFEAKRQQIEEAELAMLEAKDKRKTTKENSSETNSWIGSLIATVVGNLKISISNVHIRYEDPVSNPGHPFCSGITLAKLAAVTTDEHGLETFDTSGALDRLRKSLQLERFAVYHDSDSVLWKLGKRWEELTADEWSKCFEAGIQEAENERNSVSKWALGRQYLLYPINGTLKYYRFGKQDKRDQSVPSQKMSLTLNDVSLTVSEVQYCDGMKLLEGVSRYRTRIEVSHFRPLVSVSKDTRIWWRYACQASLHRQNKTWHHLSWTNVSRLCHLRRKYVQLYAGYLQQVTRLENKEIREIEEELDAKVILLLRLLAHARVESARSKEIMALERARVRKSSWWSFGWGSTASDSNPSNASEDSQGVTDMPRPGQLTKEEWKKLNELLSYHSAENFFWLSDKEPPDMLQVSLEATVGQSAARIVNNQKMEIICGKFESLHVGLRLYLKSIHCDTKLKLYGVSAPEGSLIQSVSSEEKEYALAATFVHSPIGENLDWKLSATMSPCYVTVWMTSFERCLQFLRRSNSVSPEVALETAAALQIKLEKVTRRAQEQFQLVLEEQSRFSLDIDLDAPILRVPFQRAECFGSCSQLLVDFGHFTLRTVNEAEVHPQIPSLYSRFYISGRDTAAFFMDGTFDWTELKHVYLDSAHIKNNSEVPSTTKNRSKLFPVLDKCGMLAVIDQIKLQHPKYPATRVSIQVPNLGLHFSPSRYSRIMNLLAIFDERDARKDGLEGANLRMGLTSWYPADLAGDARVLFWGGIGNSVAEWQSCWLALAGSYLYVLETKTSQTYQRRCSMSARQVMEIPPASVGGSEFTVAISNRGFDIQKALESSSTVVLQFKDENVKSEWMKSFVHATYKASAPLSMCIPGNLDNDESEDESCRPVVVSEKTNLSVVGTLVEMKLLIYGKEEEENDRIGEERMLLELFAGGGKVNLIHQENDLTVRMKLHSLKIEDKLQGRVSTTCKYIARSVLENDSQDLVEEIVHKCSTSLAENISEEDEFFKDALPDFSCPSDFSSTPRINLSSFPLTPRENPSLDFGTPVTNSKYELFDKNLALGEEQTEGEGASDFVSVTFVTRQPNSLHYDGTDTQMSIHMTKLDFFCNRHTVVSLIDFGTELSELMEVIYEKASPQNDMAGDAVLPSENKEGTDRLFVKGLLGTGKSRVVFQLKMNVDSVCIFLNKDDGSQLAMLVQEKFQMDLKVHPNSISIEGMLGNLRICDMSLGPDHWWGWLCDIRDTGSDSLVKWKFQSFSRDDDDFEGHDYSLIARLSAVRIVFLYRFIQEITAYFTGLATPQSQHAIQVVDKVGGMEWFIQQSEIDGSPSLKLDVSLDTPLIIMPQNSMSKNFMQLDLGHLQMSNKFEWHGCKETDPSAVHLDVLHAEITGMNMVVGIGGQLGKPMIQEACGLHIKVRRSLRDVFKKVPEVAVDIQIDLLHGVMSDKEYMVIIDCASSNISEEADIPPNVRDVPEKQMDCLQVENEQGKSNQNIPSHKDKMSSSQDGSSYTLTLVTVEIQFASLELYNGIDRESPLARMDLQGLWVAYRTSSISEIDLYVTLSKLSVLDLRPSTKPEMRLMLGSMTDVEVDGLHNDSWGPTKSDIPKLTMLVMDWRVKTDSQAFVVRMQQPRLLVVLDFLLAVGEFFVPALGIITGREESMDIQNDPVSMHDHVRLNASVYEQKEDIVFLSPHRQLIADAYDVDEFTYDGCGNTICLIGKDKLKGNSSPSLQPLIIIGYGKKLRFKNIRIKNGSRLGEHIYLSNDSSYCASIEDGVLFDVLDEEECSFDSNGTRKEGQYSSFVSEERGTNLDGANNFIIEVQAVAPELTFYDSTKWSSDNNLKGEKLLRAKLDINLMYAAKENDRWIRAFVKGLTVESGSGLAVLDPVDISGEYSCVQDKTSVLVMTTDIYVHLSLSVLRLLLRLQDETVAALQFGSANALSRCTHFDRIWIDKRGNGSSQHIAIWRPRPPSNYVILGDCITLGSVPPSQAVMAISNTYGRVKKPLHFQLVWSFSSLNLQGAESHNPDEDVECSVWMPIAPMGYTVLGCVAQIGKAPPSTSIVNCIRSDLLTSAMFSDCIYYIPPNSRDQNGFSIWWIENAVGSFFAHTSVEPPPKSMVCDLREMLHRNFSNSYLHEETTTSEMNVKSDVGSKHGVDSRSSMPRWDRTTSIARLTRYYMSTSQFDLIWWDKGSESRRAVSIWRPVPPSGYAIIGDSIVEGLDPPSLGVVLRDDDSGRLEKPVKFKKTQIPGKGLEDAFMLFPVAPPGYVSLGCIASRSTTLPPLDAVRCVRMDLVNQANMSKKAVWSMPGLKGSSRCSLWRVENQASTFIAIPDLKRPASRMAYGLAETGKQKLHDNFSGEMKIGCLSITFLDNLRGMVTPLVDNTLTNTTLAAHGRLEALNVVVVSSVAASTFNPQLEAWEPLIEPFDGIFKYEAYDANSDLPLRVGKRVRITATNVVNLNITSANVETLVGSILAWRKQVDHEQQARMAMQLEKDLNDYGEPVLNQNASALEVDDSEKLVIENRLGCDLYIRQYRDNFEDIELLKADRNVLVHLPPPRFPDRLNAVTETKASRYYVAVHILDARELMVTEDGNGQNFFCALRLVTTAQTSEEQKPFPQSARSRCVRPLLIETNNYVVGVVNWNEVFIFEVPHQGLTSLEVVVTNLSAKAGRGEAVGMVSIPMKNDTNDWPSQTLLSRIMQRSSAKSAHTFGLQPLKKKCPNDAGNECSNCGSISLTTFYFIAKGDKSLRGDSGNRFSSSETGLMVGLSPKGPWTSIRSVLPLSTIPKELNGTFGVEVVMQKGQKHAILRSLVTIVNNTDITLQVCVCPLSLLNSSDTNSPRVEIEEIFENQRYNPLSGWGNKWPGLLMSTDPGHWSRNDYSYSSKDFFEPRLLSDWVWTSDWFVEKSEFVDSDGWAYGSDFQSLKWPLSSTKSSRRSAFDFVRRRRWVRTRQQLSDSKARHTREEVAVLKPGCSTPMPWSFTSSDTDFCVQVRPVPVSAEMTYLWGRVISTRRSSVSSGNDQTNLEKGQSSTRNFIRQSKSGKSVSPFLLNQLEKTEELLICDLVSGLKQAIWLSMETDANIYSQLTHPVYDWRISVNAPLKLENKLPCNAEYIIWEKTNEGGKAKMERGLVSSASCAYIYSVDVCKPIYLTWLAQGGWKPEKEVVLLSDPSSDSFPSFFIVVHPQSKRKLRVSMERDFGETIAAAKSIRLFVPYWVCNDAALPLAYRLVEIEPSYGSETDSFLLSRAIKDAKQASNHPSNRIQKSKGSVHKVVQTLEVLEDLRGMPVMLSPQTSFSRAGFSPFSREDENLLSPRLGISVAILKDGNYFMGISFCDLENKEHIDVRAFNSNGEYYKLSAFLDLASERTKVVHFQPHTLFVNRVGHRLLIQEHGSEQLEWIYPTDPPKVLLWQSTFGSELLKIYVDGYKWSQPFSVNREGIMHINLKSELDESPLYLRTEIQTGTKESRFLVIFRHASVSSPYRIENRSAILPIRVRQAGGDDDSWKFIFPGSATSFAWEDLNREQLLEVLVDGADPRKSSKYNIDEIADHQPASSQTGPVTALRLTVFKEGSTNVVKVADWMPSNEDLAIVPVGLLESSPREHAQSAVGSDNQFHVIVELAEFGLSVVDHTPEELLYLSIQNLILSYGTGLGSGTSRFKLRLDGLQVDNQILLTPMPVLFRPQIATNQLEFLLKLTVTMQDRGLPDNYMYSYLGIQGPSSPNVVLMVKIHEPIIWRLHEMFQKMNLGRLTTSQTTDVAIDPIIRIGFLNISEIRFKVSLAMSPTQRPRGVLGFWSSLMIALGNTENMPVRITPRIHEAICMRQSALIAAAISNIRKDLLSQPLQLLYGVDILGNASSALGHMSKGVAALSMDKKFIQSRQKQEKKGNIEDIGGVIREGGGALAKGLFRGVTGILTKPLEGAKSSGVEGFVQGVGKGIIGVAAQPMSGVLDLLSKTTEGANAMRMKIISAITSEEQLLRHRLPREIGGDHVLRPYDEYRAEGQALLQLAECGASFGQIDIFKVRGKFAFSDSYEDHFNLPKGRTVIITNRRVMLLQHPTQTSVQRKIREPCTVVWDVTWDDLLKVERRHGKKDPPGSLHSQLVVHFFTSPQDSRIFESKETTHAIKCYRESRQAEEICSAIHQAMNTYRSDRSVVQFQGLEKKMVRKPYAGAGSGAGAGAALGILTGFTAPITLPVMATFAALLGTTAGQSMVDRDTDSLSYSDSKRGQHKDTENALALSSSTYGTFSSGKFINKLALVWSDQRIRWNKNYHISVWRAICPNGYISVGDIVWRSLDPPPSVMVYANKSDGKFMQPLGFDLVWRSTDDPLTIWTPRAPPGYVAIGCVVVPDYYEPDPTVVYCVRKDCVKNVDFEKQPLLRNHRDADLSECSLWQVQNDAHSFIACRDHQPPSQSVAFSVLT